MRIKCTLVMVLALLLVGCKTELYRDLPQDEANQMVALLRLNNIDAKNEIDQKTGMATLMIDGDKFINAVALLRQNGFPRPKYASIEEMFPSGQLVTSPAQEQAKIAFLKEQQLERILTTIDGVISARVSIAEATQDDEFQARPEKSASVYIKYSPQANLTTQESQIKGLIQNAIPRLSYDRISVFLQAATYGYQTAPEQQSVDGFTRFMNKIESNKLPVIIGLVLLVLLSVFGFVFLKRK